jgi:hypothetical protein
MSDRNLSPKYPTLVVSEKLFIYTLPISFSGLFIPCVWFKRLSIPSSSTHITIQIWGILIIKGASKNAIIINIKCGIHVNAEILPIHHVQKGFIIHTRQIRENLKPYVEFTTKCISPIELKEVKRNYTPLLEFHRAHDVQWRQEKLEGSLGSVEGHFRGVVVAWNGGDGGRQMERHWWSNRRLLGLAHACGTATAALPQTSHEKYGRYVRGQVTRRMATMDSILEVADMDSDWEVG